MTIAGSDSGGGAGIQADIKTFERLGVFGTSAVACLTAQNPNAVRRISGVQPDMVALQIATVCEAFRVSAAKTGMLYSERIIEAVAEALEAAEIPVLVVDPVMAATSGARLLRPGASKILCSRLLPMARVITPNVPEAEFLCGRPIKTVKALQAAAREIGERYGAACVVKGGHLPGRNAVDALFDARPAAGSEPERIFTARKPAETKTHGTGCMFSAALTAFLAQGWNLPDSVKKAKRFVYGAIRRNKSNY